MNEPQEAPRLPDELSPEDPPPSDLPPDDMQPDDGPWALQLAVRYDKADLPTHDAVCAAAARAVVTLLADPRARGEGEWVGSVRRWRDGRIRKLVRRARGVRWDNVQELPGVTVSEEGAQVRAFVPLPARPLPPELDALQVSGTSFPVGEPDPPQQRVVTIGISPYVDLSTGKAAAQCGHAAQLAWEALVAARDSLTLRAWYDDDWRVAVVHPDRPTWDRLAAPVRVVDAGFTELDGPQETTRAWW